MLATTAADVEAAAAAGRIAVIFGWQSASPLGDKSGQSFFLGDANPADRTELRARVSGRLSIASSGFL